jgi:hypothetical protein
MTSIASLLRVRSFRQRKSTSNPRCPRLPTASSSGSCSTRTPQRRPPRRRRTGPEATIRKLNAALSDNTEIDRQLNSWEHVGFREAVESAGCKKLIMAALWIEICPAFLAPDAIRNGFENYPVVDAVEGMSPAHRGLARTNRPGRCQTHQLAVTAVGLSATGPAGNRCRCGRRRAHERVTNPRMADGTIMPSENGPHRVPGRVRLTDVDGPEIPRGDQVAPCRRGRSKNVMEHNWPSASREP